MTEKINHPPHYGGDVVYEADKVIEAWGLGFRLGNVLKYICRAGKKDDSNILHDLKKAQWYLNREVQRLEEIGRGTGPVEETSRKFVFPVPVCNSEAQGGETGTQGS